MYLASVVSLFFAATCVVAQSGSCNRADPQICVVNGQNYGCYNGEFCETGCNTQYDGIVGQITYCVYIQSIACMLMESLLTDVALNSENAAGFVIPGRWIAFFGVEMVTGEVFNMKTG